MKSLIFVTALIAFASFNAKAFGSLAIFDFRNSKSATAGSIPLVIGCVADSLKTFMAIEASC